MVYHDHNTHIVNILYFRGNKGISHICDRCVGCEKLAAERKSVGLAINIF